MNTGKLTVAVGKRIESASQALEETIKALLISTMDLKERLSPIMSPATLKESAPLTKVLECSASPIAEHIRGRIEVLKEIQDIILDIETRLDL